METIKEIEIPEGYEARIEGNKVILKQKESQDERIRKEMIAFISQFAPEHLKAEFVSYLEKQKEQNPAEWGEEDNRNFYWISACIQQANMTPEYSKKVHEILSWLKSLRPKPHWKPNEEQMLALKWQLDHPDLTKWRRGDLESLYTNLQKLL